MNAKKIANNSSMNFRDTHQMWFHLTTLNEVGKALTSSLDLDEILNIVMDKIGKLLSPQNWSLLLLDEKKNELKFELVVGEGSEKIKGIRLKVGEGIAGWVAMERKPLLIPDVSKDPRFYKKVDEISNFTTKSIICVPLIAREKCLGVIELINVGEEGFREEDLLVLTTIADYTAIAIENAKYFNKVRELTTIDDLTHLYNKRTLHTRLKYEIERAKRFESDLSLIFIDLDYFKEINDKYGHICGDNLLKEFGRLVLKIIRNVDIAYRYGGDEFLILMTETSKKNAVLAAERLGKAIKKKLFLKEDKINLHVSASIGTATFPMDAKNREDLIKVADVNMYKFKSRVRNKVTRLPIRNR
ncbi:MAG: sensor domain-containing diguanylate cyclase [Nitrospinae bacterium]|nr:sensor domain-containing diguanylate cyclase [Nitrospinota bacterium]